MQISLDDAMKAVSEFMAEQVRTIRDPLKYSVGLFVVGALAKNPEGILAKARPWLEMSGILVDNMVDIDAAKAALDMAFANVPKVSYFGFSFTSEDVPALIAKMQGVEEVA